LHPAASQQRMPELKLISSDILSEKEFLHAIKSLRPRRAPDAAGWRGEYFKCLTAGTKNLLLLLAQRILLHPRFVPTELRPFLFGARLIAIPKPNGGIRPIAIGSILRKITSASLADIIYCS